MSINTIEKKTRDLIASLPKNVLLVGAVKTRTCEEVIAAVKGGLRHIGHNYMQEALSMKENFKKMPLSKDEANLLNKCKWHFIGHLQSNKVKKAIGNFDYIQTVDSIKLINLIQKETKKLDKYIKIMIEVNIAHETNKTGISLQEIDFLIKTANEKSNISLCGLMTMGSFSATNEVTKQEFQTARKIFDHCFSSKENINEKNQKYFLSMGMSDSYNLAIKNGSNMIRIGTSLFGQRIL